MRYTIEEKAQFWIDANPALMRRFINFARDAKAQGREHLGIALLVERVRWYGTVEHKEEDFKISNNHRAYIAREIMLRAPDLAGFFITKELRADTYTLENNL